MCNNSPLRVVRVIRTARVLDRVSDVPELTGTIRDPERHRAARMNRGESVRDHARFSNYARAHHQGGTTFRQGLRSVRGATEE
jgi:hypothetical protein